jgi:hypothetical protein
VHAPQSGTVAFWTQYPVAVSQTSGAVHCPFWQRGRGLHWPLSQRWLEGQGRVSEQATQTPRWVSHTRPLGRQAVSLLQAVCVASQVPLRHVWPVGQRRVAEQSSHLFVWVLHTFPFWHWPLWQSGSVLPGKHARSRQTLPSAQSVFVEHSSGPHWPVARQVEAPGQSRREEQETGSHTRASLQI